MKQTVDARGLACPQPVIRAKEALKGMAEGTLEVLVDQDVAVQNLMKLGNYSGLNPVSEQMGDREYRVFFHVGAGQGQEQTVDLNDCSCQIQAQRYGTVIAVGSKQMGNGDDTLGGLLMKSFFYALTKQDAIPETILFYNGGAWLTTEGSESLEDIKSLEEQGAEILTCGTCLDYYGLTDKLRVGSVTNMYEIAEKLMGASSIIKP